MYSNAMRKTKLPQLIEKSRLVLRNKDDLGDFLSILGEITLYFTVQTENLVCNAIHDADKFMLEGIFLSLNGYKNLPNELSNDEYVASNVVLDAMLTIDKMLAEQLEQAKQTFSMIAALVLQKRIEPKLDPLFLYDSKLESLHPQVRGWGLGLSLLIQDVVE